VGLRKGRRHPSDLAVGDAVDFWRVMAVEPPRKLVLLAEMKLPGDALLGFELEAKNQNHTEIEMVLRFLPKGLAGLAYWTAVQTLHKRVFRGMLTGIARAVGAPIRSGPAQFDPEADNVCQLSREGE
jgi:hypothetical protein